MARVVFGAGGGTDHVMEVAHRRFFGPGAASDGTGYLWRATFVVPGGTPNGTYPMEVRLRDSTHVESWTPDGSGWGTVHIFDTTTAPTGSYLRVASSP